MLRTRQREATVEEPADGDVGMSKQAAKAGRRRPRWRPRALALGLAAAAVAAAAALLALSGVFDSAAGSDDEQARTATATVARRDLVQPSIVSGTLGYDGTPALVNYRRATITSLAEEGRVLPRGGVLYRLDENPAVLFFGSQPAWRPLAPGVSDGRDVRLEQNLRALGYDDGRELTIDRRFDAATAAAVERWQEDIELPATGRVDLGDIVFLPSTRRVGTMTASLGDPIRPGARLMTTSSTERLVTAEIDAGDQQDIAVGGKVTIDLRNGMTTTGTITEVGTVASAGEETSGGPMSSGSPTSTITFEVRPDRPTVAAGLDQAPVEVGVVSERAKDALSVPVSALLARAP
jgi:hypothetical protein